MTATDELKRAAALEAVELVESGMTLGLGTGSTVAYFLELLAGRLEEGRLEELVGVPTSRDTELRARELGIPLGELADLAPLDLAVDGADEVDAGLELVKGGGGALLREKMVAVHAHRFVVIVDEGKEVEVLGRDFPVPVEVVPFAWGVHLPVLRELGAEARLRTGDDGAARVTDNGNLILDARFPRGVGDLQEVESELRARPGIVEVGLFVGLATDVLVARPGGTDHLRRPSS